jgi:hypothetical protein
VPARQIPSFERLPQADFANDLDPAGASPGYDASHAITIRLRRLRPRSWCQVLL